MGSSSFTMNIIQVLQTDETVETDTLNLSAKSFVKSPSLSLKRTIVNSYHTDNFRLLPGLL